MGRARFSTTSRRFLHVAIALATLVVVLSFVAISGRTSVSAVPSTMNFQGRLTDASGVIMPDGLYNMQFRLFTVASGGSSVWSETRETTARVQVTNGLFVTRLGEVVPIPASLFASGELYFEITMATPGTATCSTASCAAWEPPMTPRQQMSTSAYAFNSDTLDGLDSTAFAAATGSGNYIQNTGSPQTADFNITGTGTAGILQASTFDTSTSGVLTIGGTNATGITLADNTTLGAGYSLTLTGGNTASRPGSPTEGMVYYDTATKQLLTYANGKWQADRSDAVLVATSNSSQSDKDAADFVADGDTGAAADGDQVQINQALTAGTGKKVVLLAGTYTVDASVSVPNNTMFTGVGSGSVITIPNAQNGTYSLITNTDQTTGTGVAIRDFVIDGNKVNQASGSMTGISFDDMGTLSTGIIGANVSGVVVKNFDSKGIEMVSSEFTTIENVTVMGIDDTGIEFADNSSNGNKVLGSTVKDSNFGIMLFWGENSVVTNNLLEGNTYGVYSTSYKSTISSNTFRDNDYGILLDYAEYNSVDGNTIIDSNTAGIYLAGPSSNLITDNIIRNSGGATTNEGIQLNYSDTSAITGNTITDTSCTSTCYAININDPTSDNNYLSNNVFSTTSGTAILRDLGTGTRYANQTKTQGGLDILFKQASSTSAFQIQNASGSSVFNVDTTNNNITLGTGTSLTLTGGNTASRPASPTEGMVYFDTTTKQLLTYANGKWQADRTDSVLVAASNSSQSDKDAADYVADGNTGTAADGDQVQINSALTAAAGKKVVLLAGTYTVDASVSVPNNTTLAGIGNGSLVTIPNSFNANIQIIINTDQTTGTGVKIRDLKLDGNKTNQASGFMEGIELYGMGGGSGASARQGAEVTSVTVNNFANEGIYLIASDNNILTNNTSQGNYYGINIEDSINNIITNNIIQGNLRGIDFAGGADNNTITNNSVQENSVYGIHGNSSVGNTISSNKISDNGGATTNNGIHIQWSDNTDIRDNTITDTSCTTNCYAINISNAGSDNTYLSGNTFNPGTIQDLGTGTRYGGQVNSTNDYLVQPAGNIQLLKNTSITGTLTISGATTLNGSLAANSTAVFKNSSDSTTAFQIQNAATTALLTANTSNLRLEVGSGVEIKLMGVGNTYNALTKDFTCTATEAVYNIVIVNGSGTVGQAGGGMTNNRSVAGIVVAKPNSTTCTIALEGTVQVHYGTATVTIGDSVVTSGTSGEAMTSATPNAGADVGKAISVKDGSNIGWVLLD